VFDTAQNRIEVHWSRDNHGGTPYAANSVYPKLTDPALFGAGSALMVVEIQYNWTPSLSSLMIQSVPFDKLAMRWPRRSPRVQFCITAGNCTT
ncbi:MAG: hypothetical protein K2Q06_06505, partial [Parvularculaceae bacterium]|nr:hypothetical protein [Parvularculaceae bacterium]